MSILDMINGTDGAAAQQLATQFGLTREQTNAALSALLPHVTAGLQREVSTSEGETGLATALASGRHETFLAQPELLAEPATTLNGNGILGHIFGSKDVSRQVAAGAAQKTGISPEILKQMLPVIATLVMGALARQSKTAGKGAGGGAAGNTGLGGILGSLLDRNNDGSVVDDLTGMFGNKLGRKS